MTLDAVPLSLPSLIENYEEAVPSVASRYAVTGVSRKILRRNTRFHANQTLCLRRKRLDLKDCPRKLISLRCNSSIDAHRGQSSTNNTAWKPQELPSISYASFSLRTFNQDKLTGWALATA